MFDGSIDDGRYLWLPRSKVNARAIRYSLAVGDMPSEALLTDTHVRVPRHYLRKQDVPKPIKVSGPPLLTRPPIGVKTELFDYQVAPFMSMWRNGGGVLNLGCGYGKTVVSLHYIGTRGLKALVVVNQLNLISQWIGEATTHLTIDKAQIGVVQADKWDWEDKDLVIASIHTLSKRGDKVPQGFYESFGLVVFDECHHLSAPMFRGLCPKFIGERHGLSATPQREDGLESVFTNHLGRVHYSQIEQQLIPDCVFVETPVGPEAMDADEVKDRAGEVNHRRLCAYLGNLDVRHQICLSQIRALVDEGHHVLCLSHSVDHVEKMHADVPNSGLACGSVPAEQRVENIKNHRVSFATIDVAAEALNVPSLSALVILTPFGARMRGNTLQQVLGRIQRQKAGKLPPKAVFIADFQVPICRGLLRQLAKCLDRWKYPHRREMP